MDATEILQEALDLLRRDGWGQGHYHGPNGERCASGAIYIAAQDGSWLPARRRLAAVIGTSAIVVWNDDPHTTFEDVELAFKRAIAGETL